MPGAILNSDLLRESGVQETGDEYFVTRSYNVQVLGSFASDAHNQALLAPGLPQLGDPHPQLPFAICATRVVDSNSDSDCAVWVKCTYRWPRGVGQYQMRYEFGTTLRQINSSYAWDGKQLLVGYTSLGTTEGKLTSSHSTMVASVPKLFPVAVVKFTFFQKGNPGKWMLAVNGKCNKSFWEVGGGDPSSLSQNQTYTWMCTNVTANIIIYGSSLENSWYQVTGTLEYNKDTWLNSLWYTNYTGHIPPDVAENAQDLKTILNNLDYTQSVQSAKNKIGAEVDGLTIAQLYEPIDFNIAFPFNGVPQNPELI